MLNHLDLFSGIGGFARGLQATGGFYTQAFVEIDPFCQKVLKKHWPKTPIYYDIREVTLLPDQFDILTGGFPCQDISNAAQNNQQSLLESRSGLWNEFARLISEGQPKWVVIENVENLRNKGLNIILWELANRGYDAEWRVIRAADVGLPHLRKRLWIIAHSTRHRIQGHSAFPLQELQRFPWRTYGRGAENWADRRYFTPSPLLRTRNGIPDYVDRVKSLGNSLVPRIVYLIGLGILDA